MCLSGITTTTSSRVWTAGQDAKDEFVVLEVLVRSLLGFSLFIVIYFYESAFLNCSRFVSARSTRYLRSFYH